MENIKTIFLKYNGDKDEYIQIGEIKSLIYDVTNVSSISFNGENYSFYRVEDEILNDGTRFELIRKIYITYRIY